MLCKLFINLHTFLAKWLIRSWQSYFRQVEWWTHAMTAPRHRGGSVCTSHTYALTLWVRLLRVLFLQMVYYSFLLNSAHGTPLIPWCQLRFLFIIYFLLDIWGKSGRWIFSCKYSVSLRFLIWVINTWILYLRRNVLLIFQFVVPWCPGVCDASVCECLFVAECHNKLLPSWWLFRLLHLHLTKTEFMSSFSIHLLLSGMAFLLAGPQLLTELCDRL